jgi:hypothetical protein
VVAWWYTAWFVCGLRKTTWLPPGGWFWLLAGSFYTSGWIYLRSAAALF